jgi:hypothetical protein
MRVTEREITEKNCEGVGWKVYVVKDGVLYSLFQGDPALENAWMRHDAEKEPTRGKCRPECPDYEHGFHLYQEEKVAKGIVRELNTCLSQVVAPVKHWWVQDHESTSPYVARRVLYRSAICYGKGFFKINCGEEEKLTFRDTAEVVAREIYVVSEKPVEQKEAPDAIKPCEAHV